MKVTITQYSRLAADSGGTRLPLGRDRLGSETRTTAGTFAAFEAGTRFYRIATDTAIHVNTAGGNTTDQDELMPAGTSEYFSAVGGSAIEIIAA